MSGSERGEGAGSFRLRRRRRREGGSAAVCVCISLCVCIYICVCVDSFAFLPSLTGALKAGGLLTRRRWLGRAPCPPAEKAAELLGPKRLSLSSRPPEGFLVTCLNAYAFSGVVVHQSTSVPASVVTEQLHKWKVLKLKSLSQAVALAWGVIYDQVVFYALCWSRRCISLTQQTNS